MRNYSIDVQFESSDSKDGKTNLASTLALVNDGGVSDEEATKDVRQFLDRCNIDFHAKGKRELPALYEEGQGGKRLMIYHPRGEGYINGVVENPEAPEELRGSITSEGRFGNWQCFYSTTLADYAVQVR